MSYLAENTPSMPDTRPSRDSSRTWVTVVGVRGSEGEIGREWETVGEREGETVKEGDKERAGERE